MTFPAWFDFYKDPVIRRHPVACAIYASLVEDSRTFYDPRPVKAWALARELKVEKKHVLAALNLLVKRGFLIEHARSLNRVRSFTVVISRPGGMAKDTAQTA